jgi:hypothetical protein
LEEHALVAGTKKSKRAQNEAGRPKFLAGLPALFFVMAASDCFSGVFCSGH